MFEVSTKRSFSPGGRTCEHLKTLYDTDTVELLFEASTNWAQAKVRVEIAEVLLARLFMGAFEKECAPFQYALSTRAGTDCVGHLVRASIDTDPRLTILSVDGIGVYDHVLRSAMLGRLLQMPAARAILPFVRLCDGSSSSYTWVDGEGQQRTVTQTEGRARESACCGTVLLHWHSRCA